MKIIPFNNVIRDITSRYHKIKQSEYHDTGKYKIVDQGKYLVAGYTNDKALVNKIDAPVIAFGDHTKTFKYIDFPCAVGADGVKVLKVTSENYYTEYIYYFLKTLRFPEAGYSRHFKYLKVRKILVPEEPEDQIRIATLLSRGEALIVKRKESISLLEDLLKGTFLEMFGDPVRNEKAWEKTEIKKFGKVSTGNTPSRKTQKFFDGNFIEWIKTDNIIENKLYVTKAIEYLSEEGLKVARSLSKGALLVTCIAGSLKSIGNAALTDRQVAFNQQINAIDPNDDINSLFLYWLFRISKQYIQRYATKGMKKIIIKSIFEKILMIKPPIDLQKEFAVIAEKTESLKTKYETSLFELENLYNSFTQRAFRGELDLSKIPVEFEVMEEAEIKPKQLFTKYDTVEKIKDVDLDSKQLAKRLKRIIKDKFHNSFSFMELWEAFTVLYPIVAAETEDDAVGRVSEQYEVVKTLVFGWLAGRRPMLTQLFDEKRKEILLNSNL